MPVRVILLNFAAQFTKPTIRIETTQIHTHIFRNFPYFLPESKKPIGSHT